MRRLKLNPEERRIYMECVRTAHEMARVGPYSLGMYANLQRLATELFNERTGRPPIVFPPYGLTLREMVERRMRPCEICDREAARDEPNNIDHDHVSGALRGTLCAGCNVALGLTTRWRFGLAYMAKWATPRAEGREGGLADGHLTEIKWTSRTALSGSAIEKKSGRVPETAVQDVLRCPNGD